MIAKTKSMILLTNLLCTSPSKETTFTLPPTSTRYRRKFNLCVRGNLINLSAKLNKKNQAQAKMFKLSSKPWGTNSTTKVEKYRLFILPLRKEELQPAHQLLTIWEVKSLNGKFGIRILKNSKRKTKMIKSQAMRRKKRKVHMVDKQGDTRLHSRGAWRSCRGWSVKTKKIRSIMTISTIGRKDKKPKDLKESCCLFGVSAIRKRKSMSLLLSGIPGTRISLPFLLVAMTSPSKKLVRY